MRIIGVLDLLKGRAVHATGGRRDRYAPVNAVGATPIEAGDAIALARAYTGRLGIAELYVADLDAIAGEVPQTALVRAVAGLNAPAWVDAGATSVHQARRVFDAGAARAIVGLETLPSWEALESITAVLGGERVVFSLDLRDGRPVMPGGFTGRRDDAVPLLAARAAAAGAGSVIVIDLARVGSRAGPDLRLLSEVRAAVPHQTLAAGGGIRSADDLARLADAGCDAALVATALLDGRLDARDVRAASSARPRPAAARDRRCTAGP